MRGSLAAEVEQVGTLPCGEHALYDGAGRNAERLAECARLWPLRHLARAGLLVGIDDVAHTLAGDRGQLRARLEHDHPGIGKAFQEQTGIRRSDRAAADDNDGGVV